jgi:hypothetical protein
VAGEGQLLGRREDARAHRRGVRRRDEEGRLREAELARDALHRGRVEIVGVAHHRQRVSGVERFGEDVDDVEAVRHGDGHPTTCRGSVEGAP